MAQWRINLDRHPSQRFQRRALLKNILTLSALSAVSSNQLTAATYSTPTAIEAIPQFKNYAENVRSQWSNEIKRNNFADIVEAPEGYIDSLQRLINQALSADIVTKLSSSSNAELGVLQPIYRISQINKWLTRNSEQFTLSGIVVFDRDSSFDVPSDIKVLDLRGATFVKLFGSAPMISISNDACAVLGGKFIQDGDHSGYFSSPAIRIDSADRCTVAGGVFIMNQGAAILAVSSNETNIVSNRVISIGSLYPRYHADIGHDILFWGSCNYNLVARNHLASMRGIGVLFQVGIEGADKMVNNVIASNIIDGAREYGICLYSKRDPRALISKSNLVIDNSVFNIRGDVLNKNASGLIYGSGIYIQGIQESTVFKNDVSRVCQYSDSYLLGPAAISANNTSSVCIICNRVSHSSWYGAYLKDTDNWNPTGSSCIVRNTFMNCQKGGIRIACVEHTNVAENMFDLPVTVDAVQVHDAC